MTAAQRLLGRRREREALDRLVADVGAGGSRALVLRGDAGVGKSMLLHHLSQRIVDWRVVRIAGVEARMDGAYSGRRDLCRPLSDHLEDLPVPQRDALSIALGLASGPSPDRLLVGLATLALVGAAARAQPLACIVDDAHWLDQATARTLAFVARRLHSQRVGLVCATRTGQGADVLSGMPSLSIRGLDADDARELLLGTLHGPLDAAVVDRIVAECQGNPLALLELPRACTAVDLAGGYGFPENGPVPDRFQRIYLQRITELPTDTRSLVLVAAAEPLGDAALLRRAAESLGLHIALLGPAIDAELLRLGTRLEFVHPLVRSLAYGAATPDDRRRAHRALADSTHPRSHPERRTWHRALAATGPDEEVASELERVASRARAQGGLPAQAAFLRRATELTPTGPGRSRRALDAALANVRAGALSTALRLLDVAADGPVDERQFGRMDVIRAQLAFSSARSDDAASLFLAAARRLEPLDLPLACATYLDAFSAAHLASRLDDGVGVADVARAVRATPRVIHHEPGPGDLLLDAFVALTEDYSDAVPLLRRAVATLRSGAVATAHNMRWLWPGCVLALALWDDDSAYVLSDLHLQAARRAGALTELPLAISSRIAILAFCGDLSTAGSLVEEAQSVHEATGVVDASGGALTVAAWRGGPPEATEPTATRKPAAGSRGGGAGRAISGYASAVLYNGLGRFGEAAVAARRACAAPQGVVVRNWGLTELVESAARTGQTDVAVTALEELTAKAQASGTDWALGIHARSQAMLSDADAAEDLFRQAVERLSSVRVRAELARAHLVYGEWLGQRDRWLDARDQLSAAYGMFSALGMTAFADRAGRELARTSSTAGERMTEGRNALTPQEAHIARLAQDGLTNLEIAARLVLSTRTVEWHLRKVFTKLGITSRRELRRALSAQDDPDGPR